MKIIETLGAQGEIRAYRIDKIPADAKPLAKESGQFIIGHSETGHHHVIDADGAVVGVMDAPPAGMRILYTILENPTELEHLRPHDTHETIVVEPGVYEIRIAREFDHYAELARQSAD